MNHFIQIYAVCKFSYFCLWYLKSYILTRNGNTTKTQISRMQVKVQLLYLYRRNFFIDCETIACLFFQETIVLKIYLTEFSRNLRSV